MTDEEFEELRAQARAYIAAVYELPAEMVASWDELDQARTAERPASSEEKTA